MASTATKSGIKVQAWLPVNLAEQLRAQAGLERRSTSSLIRIAIEDQLRRDGKRP